MSYPAYPEYKDSGVEWLGEVPEHWEVAPVASKFELRNGYPFKAELFTGEGVPSDRLIRIRDILKDGSKIFTPESCPSWAMVKDGDVLIGMDGDFNVVYWNKGLAKLNQRVCAIRGQSVAWDKFLFYGITQPLNIINDLTFSTTVKHLSSSQVLKTRFPLPLEFEVSNIVAFLDHETARIDALVEEQQHLIELLKEKRQAVISHAVTKGLDPDVPMKDSGVEWLGEVPEHWELSKLGYLSTVVRGGAPRPAGDPTLFNGDYSPWVTVAEITKDERMYLDNTETSLTKLGSKQCRVFKNGTLLLSNSGATLGVPKILKINANANDGVVGFESLSQNLNVKFAYFFLLSLTENLRERIRQGSGQPNLNTDIVKDLVIPLPRLEEQKAIVNYIKEYMKEYEVTRKVAEALIALLAERRSALISAAVTGKIDVRGWKPPTDSVVSKEAKPMEAV